jgi:adenosylcobinamide kinase / adenosylcobinamide-phosphate guanylyltransferase
MHASYNRLILGGARSGKSRHAQALALSLSDRPIYLATSRRWDDDHAARIAKHKADRGPAWTTIEAEKAIDEASVEGRVVVVDCITLWLTNLFFDASYDHDATLAAATRILDAALAKRCTWVFVSNEIGMGVHAESAIGRKFCDLQGWANQYVAARVPSVTLMVAGIPLPVKSPP